MPQQFSEMMQEIYTAEVDNIMAISLPAVKGFDIVRINREIQPMASAEYSWNKTGGVLELTKGMAPGESLFILYEKLITE